MLSWIRRPGFALLLCGLVAFTSTGCDSSSSTGLDDGLVFSGTYVGTTDQGKDITFTVTGIGDEVFITSFEFGITLDEPVGTGCISFFAETEVSASPLQLEIEPTSFRVDIPEDVTFLSLLNVEVIWEGSISTNGTASGVLLGEQEPGGGFLSCGGRGFANWTASRI